MKLVWKLLRKHISISQLVGFFFANLCGMFIVLLSIQFYEDVIPVFTEGDSFMKKEYVVLSKPVNAIGSILGQKSGFSQKDLNELNEQPFVERMGVFTSSQFNVSAGIGVDALGVNMSTAMFFESVPDEFVDTKKSEWIFNPASANIPIILPRNYLNLYNFGFAKSRNLPQLTENVIKMVHLRIRVSGNGKSGEYNGKIVGFSNRLNTILVPEAFMKWANNQYALEKTVNPSRVIMEVNNPADERIAQYVHQKGYETESDQLDAGKATWFLKVIVGIVLGVGFVISILSFYILMLSIFLLLQKNTEKLETLLLLGYHPTQVAFPYQCLAIGLNAMVLGITFFMLFIIRAHYLDSLGKMFPLLGSSGMLMTIIIGVGLFVLVSLLNAIVIKNKVRAIWHQRR